MQEQLPSAVLFPSPNKSGQVGQIPTSVVRVYLPDNVALILVCLCQSTGTRITVYSVCCPRSTDRIVQILGKPSDCGECIKQIIALVKEVSLPIKINF